MILCQPKPTLYFAKIKADINHYMWSKHAEDIIVDNDTAFPLLDEIANDKSIEIILAVGGNSDIYQQHSHFDQALPHISKATSRKFFVHSSQAIYGLYGYWSTEELENLIDLASLRAKKILGVNDDLYFDFAFHKTQVQSTGTLDRISFLIEHINEMKKAGLDPRIFESELIYAYINAGKLSLHKKMVQSELERIDALEESRRDRKIKNQ